MSEPSPCRKVRHISGAAAAEFQNKKAPGIPFRVYYHRECESYHVTTAGPNGGIMEAIRCAMEDFETAYIGLYSKTKTVHLFRNPNKPELLLFQYSKSTKEIVILRDLPVGTSLQEFTIMIAEYRLKRYEYSPGQVDGMLSGRW